MCLRISTRSSSGGMIALSLSIEALMVARSASFCATCPSMAASLACCSAVWLIRKRRCISTRAAGASGGGLSCAAGSPFAANAARSRAASSWAAIRSLLKWPSSAPVMVGSSSMRTSPALTLWPSRTWIARTTPVSNGWIVLVRPLGMILPGATATMSTVPMHAQPNATANTAMMVKATARPTGEGGVSTISSAAGRNASSSRRRSARSAGKATTFLADFMQTCLEPIECCIAAAGLDQIVVGAVLDQAAALDGDDAIGKPQRGEPMGNDKHRSTAGDLRHVLLNDPLALIIESARRLVEDEDARVGNQRTGDGDALPLAAGQAAAALAHDRVVAFGQFEDEVVGARKLCRGDDTLGRQRGIGQRDVVPDRAVEQHVFLKHDADLAAQPGRIDLREIDAIDQHAAALGDIEALGELGERALARPGRADDAEQLARRNGQADVVQDFRAVDPVTEGDMLERDVAADRGERGAAGAVD